MSPSGSVDRVCDPFKQIIVMQKQDCGELALVQPGHGYQTRKLRTDLFSLRKANASDADNFR